MDRDANYVAVGAFVLLVIAMAVAFVFWYTDQRDKRTYQRYEIYFEGSVSGLTDGGTVRYLGVNVGKVKRMVIEPDHRDRVLVITDIDSTAPLDNRTLASLTLQGCHGSAVHRPRAGSECRDGGPARPGRALPGHSIDAVRIRRAC
jgi:phospholipid/cholesterol/gamma-HCH transport system substrate-binding protein